MKERYVIWIISKWGMYCAIFCKYFSMN